MKKLTVLTLSLMSAVAFAGVDKVKDQESQQQYQAQLDAERKVQDARQVESP